MMQPNNKESHFLLVNVTFVWSCVGQKYAVLEEKVVLATVLRHFHLKALEKREDLVLIGELVLRPRDGVQVLLTPKLVTLHQEL